MRRRNPLQRPPGRDGPPRDPKPGEEIPHVVLISSGLGLFLVMLWLGVAIIGDTLVRSALMAGLIVAIAATGYVFTHPTRSDRR